MSIFLPLLKHILGLGDQNFSEIIQELKHKFRHNSTKLGAELMPFPDRRGKYTRLTLKTVCFQHTERLLPCIASSSHCIVLLVLQVTSSLTFCYNDYFVPALAAQGIRYYFSLLHGLLKSVTHQAILCANRRDTIAYVFRRSPRSACKIAWCVAGFLSRCLVTWVISECCSG